MRSPAGLCLLAPLLASCADGDPAAEAVTVRDSGGVEIVENHVAIEDLPEWRLSPEPTLEIGALEGDPSYQLFRVADALRLPDGGLAVVNAGTNEVRLFGPEGRFRSSFGSEGEGPEEFTVPVAVWRLRDDSLLVYDAEGQRFSAWTRDGEFGRVSPLMPKFLNPPEVRGRLADGGLVFSDLYLDIPARGFEWLPLVVHVYGPDGALRDTLVTVPGRKMGVLDLGEGNYAGAPTFAARSVVHAGPGGVFLSRALTREIDVLDATGARVGSIRWGGAALDVTEADVARYREALLAAASDEESRRWTRRRLDQLPVEPTFPTLSDLRASDEGELWVRRYDRPGEGPDQRWLVFDPDGRLVARITLPENLRVFRIGGGELLGVKRDELDVEHVVSYGVIRGP